MVFKGTNRITLKTFKVFGFEKATIQLSKYQEPLSYVSAGVRRNLLKLAEAIAAAGDCGDPIIETVDGRCLSNVCMFQLTVLLVSISLIQSK
jgi:hypothetical protein